MVFKFVAIFVLIAVANAGLLHVDHQHASYNVEHHAVPLEHHTVHHDHHAPVYNSAPHQHVLLQEHHQGHEKYPDDPHPKYNFAYDVQDSVSGDSKSQTESRDGDVVHGEYSLTDADGFRRTVKYTADSVNGFNAVVHREPLAHKIVSAAASGPVHYHHPPSNVLKAPVDYSVPSHSIPQAHHDQHLPTYTTYELPAHQAHHESTHQYQHHP